MNKSQEKPEPILNLSDREKLNNGSGRSSNPKVFIPTLAADFTAPDSGNANKIWEVQTDIDLAGGNFVAPANITLFLNGGNVFNIGDFTANNTAFHFINEDSAFDLFSGSFSGTIRGRIFIATNFGAKDDGLSTTDNQSIGRTLLDMANSVSGQLIWNKKDTGIYYTSTNYEPLPTPFFPSLSNKVWAVGNGNDNVTVTHNGGVEIRKIPDNSTKSQIYVFFNTNASTIEGGTLRGDRYDHFYDQKLTLNVAATSTGNVDLRLLEFDPFVDNRAETTIQKSIPLTLSNIATNKTEIIDFINADPAFSDYTAASGAENTIEIRGQAGVYFKIFNDGGTANLDITVNHRTYEWGHGVEYVSKAKNCNIRNMNIYDFHGDGIVASHHGNGTTHINDTDMSTGNILDNGTIDSDSNFRHLTALRNLPKYSEWFHFSANAYGTVNLKWYRYKLALYDAGGIFIESTRWLEPYVRYTWKPEWVQYRLIVDYNGTAFTDFYYFINSGSWHEGAVIDNVDIGWNRRQGISNPPLRMKLTNSKIHDTGGALPEWGIDLEDNHKFQIGWVVENCDFYNNTGGDIIVKGASKGIVRGNRFKQHSFKRQTSELGSAISTGYGRETIITENFFHYKKVAVDLGVIMSNNFIVNGSINVGSGGSQVHSNTLVNTLVKDRSVTNGSGQVTDGGGGSSPSVVRDNLFIYDQPWGNARFVDEYNSIIWNNNKFRFNDTGFQHDNSGFTLPLVEAQNTIESMVNTSRTVPDDTVYKGSYTNHSFEGLEAADNQKYQVGIGLYASNVKGLSSEMSIQIGHGFPKSFTIDAEDGKVTGWFDLRLDQYLNTGSNFYDVTLKNLNIEVPTEITYTGPGGLTNLGWLNNRNFGTTTWTTVFRTPVKDVNVYVEDSVFKSLGDETGYFLYAGQRGVLEFKHSKFISKAATTETIDLTDTSRVPATTGAITFIDCDFTNVNLTLRPGDKLLYTKPNKNAPVYAGNTAAVTALGAGFWYKDSTAGNEFKVTF